MKFNILQDLSRFTVKILNLEREEVVGTGVVVSNDGKILTCAHVVRAAGIDPVVGDRLPASAMEFFVPEEALGRKPQAYESKDAEVGVYFSHAPQGWQKRGRAMVVGRFIDSKDDVVLLKVVGLSFLLDDRQIAPLGTAKRSNGREFKTFGYSRQDGFVGQWGSGRIIGRGEMPQDGKYLLWPLELQPYDSCIDSGMSGSPILDAKQNLVVGIVAEVYKARERALGVSSDVLVVEPFSMGLNIRRPSWIDAGPKLSDEPIPDFPRVRQKEPEYHDAPQLVDDTEWVGRETLLQNITTDWRKPRHTVTGLIGFGGEGKSSAARYWVKNLLESSWGKHVSGIFWWGFYHGNVDSFFESAISFFSNGTLQAYDLPAGHTRPQLLRSLLNSGQHLLVLDGMEVLQEQEKSDTYGAIKNENADLRDFLQLLAYPAHKSFCLMTSRAPLFDLGRYPAYTQHEVSRLNTDEGRALLQNIGVHGADQAVDRVVNSWGGHALTLSLLGGMLVSEFDGDINNVDKIPKPIQDESRYDQVKRILVRYDASLGTTEHAFLNIFSVFLTPVPEDALSAVFREPGIEAVELLSKLSDSEFGELISGLQKKRLIRRNYGLQGESFSTHVLVQSFYNRRLLPEASESINLRLAQYSGRLSVPRHAKSLEELEPRLNQFRYLCAAKHFDEAYWVYREIDRRGDGIDSNEWNENAIGFLVWELAAIQTDLELLSEFFPERDLRRDPELTDPKARAYILLSAGLNSFYLGNLQIADDLTERSGNTALKANDQKLALWAFLNRADLNSQRGKLIEALGFAQRCVELALGKDEFIEELCGAYMRKAWIEYLMGQTKKAAEDFKNAGQIQPKDDPDPIPWNWSSSDGIWFSDFLVRTGRLAKARKVTIANLKLSRKENQPDDIANCHRVLGDISTKSKIKRVGLARRHYNIAIRMARGISARGTLIEALLSRGKLALQKSELDLARQDLEEALSYALSGTYVIDEVEIRLALAETHIAEGENVAAIAHIQRAAFLSTESGYYWGNIKSDKVAKKAEMRNNGQ